MSLVPTYLRARVGWPRDPAAKHPSLFGSRTPFWWPLGNFWQFLDRFGVDQKNMFFRIAPKRLKYKKIDPGRPHVRKRIPKVRRTLPEVVHGV